MRRKLMIVTMLTAVVAAEGCRRGSGEKKPPISVQRESDFVFTRQEDNIDSGLEERKKPSSDPAQRKKEEEEKENARKQKEEQDVKDRRAATYDLGRWLREYRANPFKSLPDDRKANAVGATLYAFEKIRISLRRENHKEWYHDVDKGNIDVVYLVAENFQPGQILCYHKTVESEHDPVSKRTTERGHPAFFADGTGDFVKKDAISELVKRQEVTVCWFYYVQFAMQSYGRDLGQYIPSVQTNTPAPPEFIARIRARSPELLKEPPDTPDFNRFRKFLEKNAPPRLLKLIDENKLCVSMKADLRNPNERVACWTSPEPADRERRERGTIVINASGTTNLEPAMLINPWLAQNQNKKN